MEYTARLSHVTIAGLTALDKRRSFFARHQRLQLLAGFPEMQAPGLPQVEGPTS